MESIATGSYASIHMISFLILSESNFISYTFQHRPPFEEVKQRLNLMLGLNRNKSEDSLYSWTLVDAMRDSGHF